jgi:hypothetical protein
MLALVVLAAAQVQDMAQLGLADQELLAKEIMAEVLMLIMLVAVAEVPVHLKTVLLVLFQTLVLVEVARLHHFLDHQ